MHSQRGHFLVAGAFVATVMLLASTAAGQAVSQRFDVEVTDQGRVIVGGNEFESWSDYFQSDFFRQNNMRCGTARVNQPFEKRIVGSAADCTASLTNATADYDPGVVKFLVPVVFHVIENTSGTGFVSDALIQSQIDILNEDFLALPATNGASGTDIQIEFYLADEDPLGAPTTGITRHTDNNWFNDIGTYYNTIGWDTTRYLNIYTNLAGGNLGYAYLPQGSAGASYDRVVLLYSTVGRNAPYGPPYNQGRTGTHEVGHYLGLYHVFDGCGTPCNTAGDTVCDTNPQSSPNGGCSGGTSCSAADDYTNYMDYTDDLCMTHFTSDQARRMRCSLEFWRVDLFELDSPCLLDPADDCNGNCVLDSEEITGGTEFDCNENGVLDSCDLVDPITPSLDCNTNGIPDECDIVGSSLDCNTNGIPDECDIASSSLDCNGNDVPDECEDCNGNGIADDCEFQAAHSVSSPTVGPVGFGQSPGHTFLSPPVAVGDITMTFHASADLDQVYKNLQVYLNGVLGLSIYEEAGYLTCDTPPSVDTLVITAATFNAIVAGGNLIVAITAGSFVDETACAGASTIQFDLDYPIASTVNDVNANGVPDECDLARGDNNLDGVVDVDDLINMLAAWGTCADPGNCPEDTNGDGDVDVLDLIAMLAGWD